MKRQERGGHIRWEGKTKGPNASNGKDSKEGVGKWKDKRNDTKCEEHFWIGHLKCYVIYIMYPCVSLYMYNYIKCVYYNCIIFEIHCS